MNERILESLRRAEETIPMTDEERGALDRHRRKVNTELALARGKAAFEQRDWDQAVEYIREANRLSPSGKMRAKLLLLRFCPRLAYEAYRCNQKAPKGRAVL